MNVRLLLIAPLIALAATAAQAQDGPTKKKKRGWVVRKLDAAKLLAGRTQRTAADIERAVRARFGEQARVLSQATREVVVAAPEQDLRDLDGPNVERIRLEIDDRTRDGGGRQGFYVSPKELYLLRTDPERARRLPVGMVLRAARDRLQPKPGAELRIDVVADGNYVGELPNAGFLLAHWNSMDKTERLRHLSDAKREGSLPRYDEWEAERAVTDRMSSRRLPAKPRQAKGSTQAEKILAGERPAPKHPETKPTQPVKPSPRAEDDDWVPPARFPRPAKPFRPTKPLEPLKPQPLETSPEEGAQQSIERIGKPTKFPK